MSPEHVAAALRGEPMESLEAGDKRTGGRFTPERLAPDPLAVSPSPAQKRARRQWSLHFSERKLLLAAVDAVLLNTVFLGVLCLGRQGALEQSARAYWPWFIVLTAIWFLCAFILGCYDLVRAASVTHSLAHTTGALLLTWWAYLLTPYLTLQFPDSRLPILAFPLLGCIVLGGWRILYATIFVRPSFQQHALIVGAGWSGRTLAHVVRNLERGRAGRNVGYKVIGFVDDAIAGQEIEGFSVLGTRHDLMTLARQYRINEIVVAITHLETMHPELFEIIQECREGGIAITTMAGLYERLTGRVPIEHAGRALYVALPQGQSATHRFYLALQRLFDIMGSLAGCAILALVIPFVWLANRLLSPGPVFYFQERVGKGGRPFHIIKFRSMRTDAEECSGAVWAEENDPRITPVGKFLRKTRLDEMPQFWNILKGEMSIIGPRPERPHFVAQLARQIPFYRARHAVKPGATGWAQVKYRYGASVEDSSIKLEYDLYYIKHQGVLLDLEILSKTLPIMLGFKGR